MEETATTGVDLTATTTPGNRTALTTGAAAKRIGLNSKTLRRWVDTGKIDGYKSAKGLRYVFEDALEEEIWTRSKQS